ncbi:hypothetical protein OSTOST_21491, partial [Ostertagia ostertagi]
WDSRYELELHNFEECGDEGEIWFGKSAEKRIVDFVTTHIPKTAPILDLGCGNGSVLRRLRKHGYASLTGVDYCPAAIELAKRVSNEEQETSECAITFENCDSLLTKVLSLKLSALQGKFVIFSCNFTKEELCKFFADGVSLIFHSEIPAAHTISFGGRQGVTSTGVVFEKN